MTDFFVALARVNVFGILELLFGFGECGSGIFVSQGYVRDAQGVARFKKFERRFAVDAKDGVFDFGVGGGIDAAAEKFVAGINISTLPRVAGPKTFREPRYCPAASPKNTVRR